MDAKIARKTLTVEEAAKWLGLGRTSAFEAVHRGDIPHIRIGKRILIPVAALERMMEGARTTGEAKR